MDDHDPLLIPPRYRHLPQIRTCLLALKAAGGSYLLYQGTTYHLKLVRGRPVSAWLYRLVDELTVLMMEEGF